MQLQAQYPNLESMFGQGSLFNTLYGMNQYDQANAAANQNLSQAQQDQNFQAQRLPGDIALTQAQAADAQANAAQGNARVPGIQAQSGTAQDAYKQLMAMPEEQRQRAAQAHLAAQMSADDAATFTNNLKKAMTDASLPQSARDQAREIYMNSPDIVAKSQELSQQGENAARVAGIGANATIEAERLRAQSGENIANLHYGKEAMIRKALGGNTAQQSGGQEMLAMEYDDMAAQATNEADRQKYAAAAEQARQRAQVLRQQAITERAAGATAANQPKPDLSQLGIQPVNPPGYVPPAPQMPGATPAPTDTGTVLMRAPDGSVRRVPKVDVPKALANGGQLVQQ